VSYFWPHTAAKVSRASLYWIVRRENWNAASEMFSIGRSLESSGFIMLPLQRSNKNASGILGQLRLG
jgi:hypothetical protein